MIALAETLDMNQADFLTAAYQDTLDGFSIPEPVCPFPAKINSHFAEAQEHSIEWISRFRLLSPNSPQARRFPQAQIAKLAALTHPDVSLEDLKLATDWHCWLFAHDDICDDSEIGFDAERLQKMDLPLLAQMQQKGTPSSESPLGRALDDLIHRIYARSGPGWLRRFLQHAAEYLSSNVWEARNRQNGVPPKLEDYMAMRRYTGAVLSCFDLIFVVEDLLPEACSWLNDPLLRELESKANNHICWINDIFGLEKEIREHNVNNLVLVLQQEYGCELQTAATTAVSFCNKQIMEFNDILNTKSLQRRYPGRWETISLNRYIDSMKSWMGGHVVWYQHTGRYLPYETYALHTC